MPEQVLLVGSSFSAAPVLFALKQHGLHVHVCGNLPSDPCHAHADGSHYTDYSNAVNLESLLTQQPYAHVVPTCNDYSYLSCAQLAEKWHLPGFDSWETCLLLHTKNRFRAFMERHNLSAPKCRLQTASRADIDGLRFPLLVKPIDSFSGRGMTRLHQADGLSQAVERAIQASPSGEIVIEEFKDGTLHSHSAFIKNQEILFDFFVDEFCTVYPYQVDCSNHPSGLSEAVRTSVRTIMTRLIQILELVDGLLHTQFIVHGQEVWIIECMRRCPGDLYGHLIERSTGLPYTDCYLKPFIGQPLELPRATKPLRYYGRHTISTRTKQNNFCFRSTIPAKETWIVPLKESGHPLKPAPFDKLAILFCEFADMADTLRITPHLAEHIRIESLDERFEASAASTSSGIPS
ncbi:MAG: hypothetical protein H7834_08605 [Magnetococcus sp. YQC-9]